MTDSEIDLLSGVLRGTEATMLAVAPDQLDHPTPCPDYDVARLLDHLVGWARSFAARLSGEVDDGDPNDYRAGEDPVAEFHAAAQTIVTSFRSGTDTTQTLPVGILVPEFLTHGWDLARATGQQLSVDPEAAELGLRTVQGMLKPEFRGAGQSFGPEVPVAASAPAIDRLVGFMGRDPGWTPAA